MKFSAYKIYQLKIALWIIVGYVCISALYSLNVHAIQYTYDFVQFNYDKNEYVRIFSLFDSLRRSTPIGLAMGILTAVIELAILPKIVWRLNFLMSTLVRIIGYIIITIPIVYYSIIIEEMIISHKSYSMVITNQGFQTVVPRISLLVTIISTLSAFGISFIRLVGRKFGKGVLLQYIFGKYHQPREEERIFMFMNMKSSGRIAEQLDHTQYHKFLNDVFHDITEPILDYGGEIYQYVGDEIILMWPINAGIENQMCIRCYFAICAVLERKNPEYRKRYGVEAKMKAGIHCGTVTTAEIGDLKTEIVYHGDTVNTTSRIQEMCDELRSSLLVSGELLHRCYLSDKFAMEGGGTLKLRGKEKEIELYSIVRKSNLDL